MCFQEVLKFEATWSQVFGGDEAIAGTPTNPPFEQCFAGSQHSKHTSEILRCHPSNQLNKVVVTSCYVSIFVFDNFPNKNMSYVTFLHFPPTKKHPQKKHEITQQAKPTKHHPLSHHGPAGRVCVFTSLVRCTHVTWFLLSEVNSF